MEKPTTFAVNQDSGKKLRELAKKYNTSAKDFAQKMILYFYRTGHDPEDLKVEGSTEAIKKLDKRLISFIRTQEKEKLAPMLEEIGLANKQLHTFMEQAPSKDQLRQIVENQKKLKSMFEEIMSKR